MEESGILSLKNQAISGVGETPLSRIHTAYIGGKYLHFSHEKASRSKGKKKNSSTETSTEAERVQQKIAMTKAKITEYVELKMSKSIA